MEIFKKSVLAMLALILGFACSNEAIVYENVADLVDQAKITTSKIDAKDLITLIDEGESIQIIDCREEDVYSEGHIKGAINVPRGILEFSSKISDRRKTTIIFGNDQGSAVLAASTLRQLKYYKCFWVDCTWEKWSASFHDRVETGLPGNAVVEKKVESSGGCGD